jgi:predicted RNA-binding protein YlqC (UPF0109 family)
MKDLVEFVAKSLVDHPDDVEVVESTGERTTILVLRVAQSDLGKVIGRQGRTVKALRIVLNGAATRANRRAVLDIQDRETGTAA